MIVTQADRKFYNEFKDRYTHIISIVCPDEKELIKPIHKHHWITKMWDVDKVLENQFRKYEQPSAVDIMATISWANIEFFDSLLENKDFRLLIHCDAGISRSTAITLGILWDISQDIFKDNVKQEFLRLYLDARKQWCKSLLDWNVSIGLSRYIDDRYNPSVKPNQAILKILREQLTYFPW